MTTIIISAILTIVFITMPTFMFLYGYKVGHHRGKFETEMEAARNGCAFWTWDYKNKKMIDFRWTPSRRPWIEL